MKTIFFFSIPAHGHTNPTLPVVAELVRRGHRVRYYSFAEFEAQITAAGAEFFDCTSFLPPAPPDLDRKAGRDFSSLIGMIADTTLAMDDAMDDEFRTHRPDCVVSDSLCYWGKLFAKKHGVPFVCSTTSFAFNQHTAGLMKQRPGEVLSMLLGMPRIGRRVQALQAAGYPIGSFVEMVRNDNDTNTIVYTSRQFQPMAETFGSRYRFVGPVLRRTPPPRRERERELVYIALGTVLERRPKFYQNCIRALGGAGYDVVIAAGRGAKALRREALPGNVTVEAYADQIGLLAQAAVFVTHCGMNSVSESLYCGTPMVLYPQTSEQGVVADRAAEIGAGLRLRSDRPRDIRRAVETVLSDPAWRHSAQAAADALRQCGGAGQAADFIECTAE